MLSILSQSNSSVSEKPSVEVIPSTIASMKNIYNLLGLDLKHERTQSTVHDGRINKNLMKLAQIPEKQAKELISLTNRNVKGIKFRIVLPKYVPPKFFLDRVEMNDGGGTWCWPRLQACIS
jgi:hypothetical protein